MKSKLLLVTALAFGMVTAVAGAGEMLHPTQKEANNNGISQGEFYQKGFFDSITSLLSFSGVQDTYNLGEKITVQITAETKTSYNTADAVKVVEVYKCADTNCDSPPPISSSSQDQCTQEEWYPDYDDCIAKDESEVSFSAQQDVGTSWTWDVSFNGFKGEAQYILVGYVWTPDQGIVTDISKKQFTVESSNNDDSQSDQGTSPKPVIEEVDGDIPVTVSNGEITATPEFINTGKADMPERDIVEMQVRPEGSGLLSFISRAERTCDADTPENVHRSFRLDSGDSRKIPLSTSTSNVEGGERYDVWIVTREECGGAAVEPYGTGVIADTVFIEATDSDGDGVPDKDDTCPDTPGSTASGCPVEPQIEQASEEISLQVTNSKVKTSLSLINTGEQDMREPNIIEMQVVPAGQGLFSLTSTSKQKVCDSDYPQNVHREYTIAAGETLPVNLSTSLNNLESGQKYDVWIVTREECGGGPATPYGTGTKVGSFTYKASNPTEVCGNNVDDDSDGKVDENCGDDLPVLAIVGGLVIVIIGGVIYFRG